jgi:transposase-like protein
MLTEDPENRGSNTIEKQREFPAVVVDINSYIADLIRKTDTRGYPAILRKHSKRNNVIEINRYQICLTVLQ